MIKILEQGQKTFTRTCDRCGCKFQYDLSDLSGLDYISCPFCHTTLTHVGPKAIKMDLGKTNKVDWNTTIYTGTLPDDIVDDPYNNIGMSLPDSVKDNCCYESDDYKAWYEKWHQAIVEKEPIKCKND